MPRAENFKPGIIVPNLGAQLAQQFKLRGKVGDYMDMGTTVQPVFDITPFIEQATKEEIFRFSNFQQNLLYVHPNEGQQRVEAGNRTLAAGEIDCRRQSSETEVLEVNQSAWMGSGDARSCGDNAGMGFLKGQSLTAEFETGVYHLGMEVITNVTNAEESIWQIGYGRAVQRDPPQTGVFSVATPRVVALVANSLGDSITRHEIHRLVLVDRSSHFNCVFFRLSWKNAQKTLGFQTQFFVTMLRLTDSLPNFPLPI